MKVIFNADDLGLTRGINAGILEAYEHGVLRSASLIVTAEAAEDAVALIKARPGLDVGLHITLVEERPILPPIRIPSLVADGRFLRRASAVYLRYALGRWNVDEAEAEIAAQLDRMRSFGLEPSHLDGHQHLHLLPRLFPSVIALARHQGIRFVRSRVGDPLAGAGSLARIISALAINEVSRLDWGKIDGPSRMAMIPFSTVGFVHSGGTLTTSRLLGMLDKLRQDVRHSIVEVVVHPGHIDTETEQRYGHWRYRWENDLALLLDPTLPESLVHREIQVTSFRDLNVRTDVGPLGSCGIDGAP